MTAGLAPTSEDVLIVSGGARGVTAACVVELAQRHRCQFLLLGRSEPIDEPEWAVGIRDGADLLRVATDHLRARGERATPPTIQGLASRVTASREIAQTIAALQALGSQAEYVAADVTDVRALATALGPALARQSGGHLGLIHGAGALSDRLIGRKSAADFDLVYGPKVRGLANLLDCLPIADLRYLVLFASAAGFFGNSGQSDYALANEILNRVAHQVARRAPGCRVLSLNWGPWDGGMVSPALKRLFSERGVETIPYEGGARAMADILIHAREPVQVVVGTGFAPLPALNPERSRSDRVWRELSAVASPSLRDHVVGGSVVLPSVCAVQWFSSVSESIRPGFHAVAIDRFSVFKGVVFDGHHSIRCALDIVEVEASEDRVVFDNRIWSEVEGSSSRSHYGARLTLTRETSQSGPAVAIDTREDSYARPGESLYCDGTLFHGPAFRGIRRLLNASPERLTVECLAPEVSPFDRGQFVAGRFNPFAADTLLQAQVVWARLFRDVGSLPLCFARLDLFQTLRFEESFFVTVSVTSVSDSKMVADVVATTSEGMPLLRIIGSEITLSAHLNHLFVPAASHQPGRSGRH